MLICPKCQQDLIKKDRQYICKNHHCYDISKEGYVNLKLGNTKSSGDEKAMIQARTHFLSQDHYLPLAKYIYKFIQSKSIHALIDAGCGEGYYTKKIKENCENIQIFGFDLSKVGIQKASKACKDIQYVVASIFHLPIANESVDGILSIFAPFDTFEFKRILCKNGYFIKVSPGKNHLMGLKKILYENVYENIVEEKEYDGFICIKREILKYNIHLVHQDTIQSLFMMTPYYHNTSKLDALKLETISMLDTEIEFLVEVYQKIV